MWILSEAVGSGKQGVILVSPSAASPGFPLASALGKQRGWRLHAVMWVLRCITSFQVHPAECTMRSLTWSHAVRAASGAGEMIHRLTCPHPPCRSQTCAPAPRWTCSQSDTTGPYRGVAQTHWLSCGLKSSKAAMTTCRKSGASFSAGQRLEQASNQPRGGVVGGWGRGGGPSPCKSALPCNLCWPWNWGLQAANFSLQ